MVPALQVQPVISSPETVGASKTVLSLAPPDLLPMCDLNRMLVVYRQRITPRLVERILAFKSKSSMLGQV